VCVRQAEHIALEQLSQLSSSHSGQLEPIKMNGVHPRGEGGYYKLQPPPLNIEIKNTHNFCRHDAIKHLMRFTLQPNPTTELG